MARRHCRQLVVRAAIIVIGAVGGLVVTDPLVALQRASGPGIQSSDFEERRDLFIALIGTDRATYLGGGIADVGAFVRDGLGARPRTDVDADQRKRSLLELLEVENAVVAAKESERRRRGLVDLPVAERFTEAHMNYYGDLIAAIAALRDVRSVEALAGAIATGSMAVDSLVSFGPMGVGPVADRITDEDPTVRASVALTLSETLGRSEEVARSSNHRATIRKAMLAAAKDPDPFVRARAVRGLARLGDSDSVAIVRRLANEDPYFDPFSGPQGRYTVREAAEQALKGAQ
jgi:hypothetical protein